MLYLWDTNIVSLFDKNHPVLNQHLARVPWEQIALPSVVIAEMLRGRCETVLKATPEQAPFANQKLIETYDLLRDFNVVRFDEKAAEQLARLKAKKKSKKRYADTMIAAIALARLEAIFLLRATRGTLRTCCPSASWSTGLIIHPESMKASLQENPSRPPFTREGFLCFYLAP